MQYACKLRRSERALTDINFFGHIQYRLMRLILLVTGDDADTASVTRKNRHMSIKMISLEK